MKKLTLPFLGKRCYIHSTSLLKELLYRMPPKKTFCLKIIRPLYTNRIAIIPLKKESSPDAIWTKDKNDFALTSLPSSSPIQREDYDEDSLALLARFTENTATWFAASAESHINLAVLALKYLLLRRFPPKNHGQWLFIRWDGLMPIPSQGELQLHLVSVIEKKMAMAKILHRNAPWATLYFAWSSVPPSPPCAEESRYGANS